VWVNMRLAVRVSLLVILALNTAFAAEGEYSSPAKPLEHLDVITCLIHYYSKVSRCYVCLIG